MLRVLLFIASIVGIWSWMIYEIKKAPCWPAPPECFDCNEYKGNPCKNCKAAVKWRAEKWEELGKLGEKASRRALINKK